MDKGEEAKEDMTPFPTPLFTFITTVEDNLK